MNQKIAVLSINLSAASSILIFGMLSVLCFVVPFSLGHPQWLVGSAVNASLFLAALFLPKKYFLPLALFPSLGVLARGIIFGPLTLFLVYFLPFIWLANLVLMIVFKKLLLKYNHLISVFLSAAAKFLILFLIANIYFEFHIVPKMFLQSMGTFQLFTALVGGLISFIIFSFYASRNARS